MTGLLASVKDPAEAALAVAGGADLIDLKDPATGALGALPPDLLAACVEAVAGRRLVSATIGDVALAAAPVLAGVDRALAAGVDIIKIGLFAGDLDACLAALAPRAAAGTLLVAVLFADRRPDPGVLVRLAAAGFVGAMLDTMDKGAGSLRRHMTTPDLATFVRTTRELGLVSGLAGSLRLDDVPALLKLAPTYLGFRTALCDRTGRAGGLDPAALAAVRGAVQTASSPTATAGAHRAEPSAASGAAFTRVPKSW